MSSNKTPEVMSGEQVAEYAAGRLPSWATAAVIYRDRDGRIVGYGHCTRVPGGLTLDVTDDLAAWEGGDRERA